MNEISLNNKYDKALYYEIFFNKEYSILDDIIKNSKLIFDVGGHIGLFSLYCFQINSDTNIHLFEPIIQSFQIAQNSLDSFRHNVKFNNVGVSTISGEGEIYFNPTKTMQSSFYNNTFLNIGGEKHLVKFVQLNNYIEQNGISYIDLLKIDIEGMELDVLIDFLDGSSIEINAIFFEALGYNLKIKYPI